MARRLRIVLLLVLLPAAAGAEGFSGFVEENVSVSHSDNTDSTGATQSLDSWQWTQRYRLSLERTVFPTIRVAAGGQFERALGETSGGGFESSLAARAWNAFGNVTYAIPTLTLGGGYIRRESYGAGPVGLVHDEYTIIGSWRPEALPFLFLRLARPHTFDTTGTVQDLISYDALFGIGWKPVRQLDLGYSLNYSNPHDNVRGSETITYLHTGNFGYGDRLLGGRSVVSVTANVNRRITEVRAAGAGATFETLQTPISGLSLVETGIATPARDTLAPNTALINGDLVASAGVNLGTSASTPTADYRDIGAQFADAATIVNTLYVWIDRELTIEVAQAIQFEVWQSDNNLDWAQVPVVKQFSAQFVTLQNRFEITIADTRARYLKVVTRPILTSVSTDVRFRDIFVTELQLASVQPLPPDRRVDTTNGAVLSASARTLLLPALNLAYDFSLYLSAQQRPNLDTAVIWLVLNGLSVSRQLSDIFLASARVARQDADQLRGHEATFLYSASLGATPVPTLTSSLVYSGQYQQLREGDRATNSISLFTQATPYQGIGLVADLSYSIVESLAGQTLYTDTLTLTTTLQPNPRLGFAGSFAHTATTSKGGGVARTSQATNRIDGTITFTPFRALFVSLTATHFVQQPRSVTLANAAVSFNPFPGGDLQIGGSYNETLDADESHTRFFGPFLRWNIRRGTVLYLNYTILDVDRHAQGSQHSRTLGANLAIPL